MQVRFLTRYGIVRVQVSQLKIKIPNLSNGAKSWQATDGSTPSLQQGIMPKWWNWYTRWSKKPMPKGLRVRVSSNAPIIRIIKFDLGVAQSG